MQSFETIATNLCYKAINQMKKRGDIDSILSGEKIQWCENIGCGRYLKSSI